MPNQRIEQVERYVKETMGNAGNSTLGIAHDFKHVDRVRNWALKIAEGEGFRNVVALEIAALLHDIGFPYTNEAEKYLHGPKGAEMAADFLAKSNVVADEEREMIVRAIKYHSAAPSAIAELTSHEAAGNSSIGSFVVSASERNMLLQILQEADNLDGLGAVGIMRAFTSKFHLPEYDPQNIKGETWGLGAHEMDERKAAGLGIGHYIIDQINSQIAFSDNLRTPTARRIAAPMLEFMKAFLVQLEIEIVGDSAGAADRC